MAHKYLLESPESFEMNSSDWAYEFSNITDPWKLEPFQQMIVPHELPIDDV